MSIASCYDAHFFVINLFTAYIWRAHVQCTPGVPRMYNIEQCQWCDVYAFVYASLPP